MLILDLSTLSLNNVCVGDSVFDLDFLISERHSILRSTLHISNVYGLRLAFSDSKINEMTFQFPRIQDRVNGIFIRRSYRGEIQYDGEPIQLESEKLNSHFGEPFDSWDNSKFEVFRFSRSHTYLQFTFDRTTGKLWKLSKR